MRARLLVAFGGCLAAFAVVAACELNPQPLPPGEQPDGGGFAAGGSGSGGSNGATGAGSDGGALPIVTADASVSGDSGAGIAADAEADSASDASGDGGDGASDAESEDAALDASGD
jgi:hypothetical protein